MFGGGGYHIPFLLVEMVSRKPQHSQDRVRWPEWKYDVNTGCFPALVQTAKKVSRRLKTRNLNSLKYVGSFQNLEFADMSENCLIYGLGVVSARLCQVQG